MFIDFRSDTVTTPTIPMRESVLKAEVGDDFYGDDKTTIKLQELACKVTGKEASIFVPSGIMGNQLSIMSHTKPHESIIVNNKCHINTVELQSTKMLPNVHIDSVSNDECTVYDYEIQNIIKQKTAIECIKTTLLCLENATTMGNVIPLNTMEKSFDTAKFFGLSVHLDGARIFNASTYLNVDVKSICNLTDSVMFCLSKGLCAPMGSMVCGTTEFIQRVKNYRKIIGGGQRQIGFVTASGIIAINEMSKRLQNDHDNAQFLANALSQMDCITCDIHKVNINIVICKIDTTKFNIANFSQECTLKNIKITPPNEFGIIRFVTHNDITLNDCKLLIDIIKNNII